MDNSTLKTLLEQLEKIHKHCRQNSIDTRRRYKLAMKRFLKYVAQEFRLQKVANISNKHLASYVTHLQDKGCSANYIIAELSAVRFYCDQIAGRYRLTKDNQVLGVNPRGRPQDRAWTFEEYQRLIEAAYRAGKLWLADVIALGWELGLRVHEAVRIYRVEGEQAIKTGKLLVKGKNGKVRFVHVTPQAMAVLERAKNRVPRGARLFANDQKVHSVIADVQRFIRDHRDPKKKGKQITYHGLRYANAQHYERACREAGMTEAEAHQRTSEHLGHRRPRITTNYVGPFGVPDR